MPAGTTAMVDRVHECKTWFETTVRREIARRAETYLVTREGREVGDTVRHALPPNCVLDYRNGAVLNFEKLSAAEQKATVERMATQLINELVGARAGRVFVVQGEPVDFYINAGHLYYVWRIGCIADGERQQRSHV